MHKVCAKLYFTTNIHWYIFGLQNRSILMKNSKLIIYILFSITLALSVVEFVLTTILLSKNKDQKFSDTTDIIKTIDDMKIGVTYLKDKSIVRLLSQYKDNIPLISMKIEQVNDINDLVIEFENLKIRDEHLSKFSATYLMLFNFLSILLLCLTFLTTSSKRRMKKKIKILLIGTVAALKIAVYIFLLIHGYIYSERLELSSAVIGFINSVVLLGLLGLKIVIFLTK